MYTSYFITYLCCLCRTTRNTFITIETTSPITAIANNAAKTMIMILLSLELPSLHASIENNTPL